MAPAATDPTPKTAPPQRRLRAWKVVVFSFVPSVLVLGGAELAVRIWGLADPTIRSMPLPGEYEGLFRADGELFWSLRPGVDLQFQGERVRIGSQGLRGPEIPPKRPGEFRILSLGESSTFGPGVPYEKTYSALLEEHLREADARAGRDPERVRVVNAGVPAYSSFQSLRYLRTRGIDLEPDLVLFYHQINDYMPSSLRTSQNDEIGLARSDRELHESGSGTIDRFLLGHSALYRFLALRMARHRIRKLQEQETENPLLSIGLPDIGLAPRTVEADSVARTRADLDEQALPPRVRPEERRRNLEELARFCDERGIRLLVIHPAYRESTGSEERLVAFCRENDVPFLHAGPVLHPPDEPRGSRFLDSMHPNAEGHAALARALADAILEQGLYPPSSGSRATGAPSSPGGSSR